MAVSDETSTALIGSAIECSSMAGGRVVILGEAESIDSVDDGTGSDGLTVTGSCDGSSGVKVVAAGDSGKEGKVVGLASFSFVNSLATSTGPIVVTGTDTSWWTSF